MGKNINALYDRGTVNLSPFLGKVTSLPSPCHTSPCHTSPCHTVPTIHIPLSHSRIQSVDHASLVVPFMRPIPFLQLSF